MGGANAPRGNSMQVSVETTSGLERRLTVQIPAERVEREVETRLQSLGKRVKIKGFRPGKVPFKVVKQQYGAQIREEVVGDLLQSTWQEAVLQEKLHPAGGPTIDKFTHQPGQDLEYTATFEIYPDIPAANTDSLKVERPHAEITATDVDAVVENLREQRSNWEPVSRQAAMGDQLLIDFEGDINGESFSGNRGERTPVELGSGRMVTGFEEQLVGASAGESRDLQVTFPDDYRSQELAGKQAHFKVTVHEVSEKVLPPLDEEFCRSYGVESGDLDELRHNVQENMQREMDEAIRRKLKERVLDSLLVTNPVDVPKALVDDEIERARNDMLTRLGVKEGAKAPELPRELFAEQATRRVALGLLIGEVIKRENITLDRARVDKTLEDMTTQYADSETVIQRYRSNPGAMRQIESLVLEDQVVDWLLEHADIRDQPTTFKALMHFGTDARQGE